MRVHDAKAAARRWVLTQARRMPGYQGAFYHGSSNWLPDDAELSATSDLDVMVLLEASKSKAGKLLSENVLLDVSYISRDELGSAEQILGTSHLAGSLRAPGMIDDPTGHLHALQRAVAAQYAERRWVRARCEHAAAKMLGNLRGIAAHALWPEQVMAWLFGTGLATHVLLAAGLRNPTVRSRYVAARALLLEYGQADFYGRLLELLGCSSMSAAAVQGHLDALSAAFDVAATLIRTPFFFASDISALARPIAIDGSRELIERGLHREAVFWIAASYGRCMIVFEHDAPEEVAERFRPGYQRLLGELGIAAYADLQQRARHSEQFLPRVWEVAEAIMASNPAITG